MFKCANEWVRLCVCKPLKGARSEHSQNWFIFHINSTPPPPRLTPACRRCRCHRKWGVLPSADFYSFTVKQAIFFLPKWLIQMNIYDFYNSKKSSVTVVLQPQNTEFCPEAPRRSDVVGSFRCGWNSSSAWLITAPSLNGGRFSCIRTLIVESLNFLMRRISLAQHKKHVQLEVGAA